MKLALKVVGPTVFRFALENKAVLFASLNPTEVSNIIYWRSLTLKWAWPPIIWVSCFTDDEPWERD